MHIETLIDVLNQLLNFRSFFTFVHIKGSLKFVFINNTNNYYNNFNE